VFDRQSRRASPATSAFGSRNGKRFRGGLVFKAHRLLYHSTLGLRVIKNNKKVRRTEQSASPCEAELDLFFSG